MKARKICTEECVDIQDSRRKSCHIALGVTKLARRQLEVSIAFHSEQSIFHTIVVDNCLTMGIKGLAKLLSDEAPDVSLLLQGSSNQIVSSHRTYDCKRLFHFSLQHHFSAFVKWN
jgi:hypothetical protein